MQLDYLDLDPDMVKMIRRTPKLNLTKTRSMLAEQ